VRNDSLRILAGSGNPPLAKAIADHLDTKVSDMLLGRFSDGEIRVKIEESLRGMDVFLVQPTSAPVNEHVMELLIIVDALRRASAARINVVIPYYGYARQDKKIKPREPVTARLIADLITLGGADRVLAIDLHAEQVQGFFNIPVDHLYAGPLIADYLISHGIVDSDVVVVSPDVGGVSRAQSLSQQLDASLAIIAKRRPEPNQSEVISVIGDVRDRTCVMIDDMIDTGGSIAGGADALTQRGAKRVIAACTHGVLSGPAVERLENSSLEQVIITDTINHPPGKLSQKFHLLSVAPLLAEAIHRIHRDASVSELFLPYL
jgi:ribose-phosphate pyrophosphokinase